MYLFVVRSNGCGSLNQILMNRRTTWRAGEDIQGVCDDRECPLESIPRLVHSVLSITPLLHLVECDLYFVSEYRRQCPIVHWTEVSGGWSSDPGEGAKPGLQLP